VSMADREHVLSEKLLLMPGSSKKARPAHKFDSKVPLDQYLDTIEQQIIKEAMIETGGNISRAAEVLQIRRQTLQHKLKKYHIMG